MIVRAVKVVKVIGGRLFSSIIDGENCVEYQVGVPVRSRPGDGPLCVFYNPAAARAYWKDVPFGGDSEYQRWWCRVTCSSELQAWFHHHRHHQRYYLYTDVVDLGDSAMLVDTVMLKAEVVDDD